MAHKSHRQKALQSQLEGPREISLVSQPSAAGPSKPKKPISAPSAEEGMEVDSDTDDVLINQSSALHTDPTMPPDAAAALVSSSSGFAPLSAKAQAVGGIKNEFRRIPVPDHRMTPMKREWVNIYTPLVEQLGLQVRMNQKRRAVEIRVSRSRIGIQACQGERANKSRAQVTLSIPALSRKERTLSRRLLSDSMST